MLPLPLGPSRAFAAWMLALLVVVASLDTPTCRASVVPLPTEDIARMSALAVRGVVLESRSRWTKDRSKIVTWVAIRLEEVYRGTHSRRRLIVEIDGGEVDGIGLVVTDVPSFAAGSRVVLFLEPATSPSGRAIFRVVGDAQGAYRVGGDGVARKNGFHVVGDPSLVEWELPLEDLARKAKVAR